MYTDTDGLTRISNTLEGLHDGNGSPWTGLLEVFQAYHRWQNAFSPCQAAAQEFFQRPPRGLCSLHRDYPPHKHYLLQQAFPACLPNWEQRLALSFRTQEEGELPLANVVVPSGPGTWGTALDDARIGYVSPTGERVMARVRLQETGPDGESVACFTLIGCAEQAAFLRDLLDRIESWMATNPHLRGAKLDAKGAFLKLERAYTWEDIILGPSTQREVADHILKFLERLPRYQAAGLPGKRGVLLVGPPGTGKTLLGKVLCATLPTTFVWVSPGQVESPQHLQHLFEFARELQPTILFLEDLDLYASRRGNGADVLLGELLNQMDGFRANRGLLTLATTNDLKAIEPALADRPSRFDRIIRIDPPKPPERVRLFERLLVGFQYPPEYLRELATATDGLTGAHLGEIVHLAVQLALDAQAKPENGMPPLTAEHLREAVQMVRQQRTGGTGFYV